MTRWGPPPSRPRLLLAGDAVEGELHGRRWGPLHPLGLPRRTRRVEHRAAGRRVAIDGLRCRRGQRGLVVIAEQQYPIQGEVGQQLLGVCLLGEHHGRAAVSQHVGRFLGREMPVHRRHPHPCCQRRQLDLDELGPVARDHRYVATRGHAVGVPQERCHPGHPIRKFTSRHQPGAVIDDKGAGFGGVEQIHDRRVWQCSWLFAQALIAVPRTGVAG